MSAFMQLKIVVRLIWLCHRVQCFFGSHVWRRFNSNEPYKNKFWKLIPNIHCIPTRFCNNAWKLGKTVQVCEWCHAYRATTIEPKP